MKLIMQLIMRAFVFSGVNVKVDAFSHRPFLLKKWLLINILFSVSK